MKDREIKLHSKDLGDGRFEVEGVIFYCVSHTEAIRKYLRGRKPIKCSEEGKHHIDIKDKFIRFLKDNHAFDEYKKEILPYRFDDLKESFTDGGHSFLLQDGSIFFYNHAVTGVNWKELGEKWEAFCESEDK